MSPLQQESVCKDAFELYRRCKSGWENAVWGGFYFDEATSRTTKLTERPVASVVLAATQENDAIIAAKYDRIFANVIAVCETIEMIQQRHFRLCILDLDLALDNYMNQAVYKIMAVVKELEVNEIRQRARDTNEYRFKAGLPCSGAHNIPGWLNAPYEIKGTIYKFFVPHDREREYMHELVRLRETEFAYKTDKSFLQAINARRKWHPRTQKRWGNQSTLKRWLDCTRAGFPLPNGSHEPAKPPPDAVPLLAVND